MSPPDSERARPDAGDVGSGVENMEGNTSETIENALEIQGGGAEGFQSPTRIFADTAPGYWAVGLPVIPLHRGSKKPAISDWSQFCGRMPTEDEQQEWVARFPNGNIGLPMGPASGFVAFDVDTRDEALIKLIEERAPSSEWKRVGAKGFIQLYKYNGDKYFQIKGKDGKVICELLPKGRQIVLPPSIHPDTGKAYLADDDLVEVMRTIKEYPEIGFKILPADFEVGLREALVDAGVLLTGGASGEPFELPLMVPDGGRWLTMRSFAAQLASFRYPPEVIRRELHVENAVTCKPPLDDREIERMVQWACTLPSAVLTDQDASVEFAREYGSDHKYGGGTFWRWTGNFWTRDQDGAAERAVKEFCENLEKRGRAAEDKKARKMLVGMARKFKAQQRRDAVLKGARSELEMVLNPGQLDSNPMLFNVANGTIDLSTGKLRLAKREDLISKQAPVIFDPDARCPTWEQCLLDWFLGDFEMIAYMQRCVGYILSGDIGEEIFFVATGTGRNGKSKMLETLRALLGDYAMAISRKVILASGREGGGPTPEVVALAGPRLGTFSENKQNAEFNVEIVKGIVGGDKMSGRLCHENQVEFSPQVKLVLVTNYLPRFNGADYAFVQRIHVWPFVYTVPEDERDTKLGAKLEAELSGVLNWALAGCLEWQRQGLNPPAKVIEAREAYAKQQDRVGAFLDENCELGSDFRVSSVELYNVYRWWASTEGFVPANSNQFRDDLMVKQIRKGKSSTAIYVGVRLKRGPGH